MSDKVLEDLAPMFDFVTPPENPDDVPAFFSFCLPNIKALSRWHAFPRAALPSTGRAAAGSGLTEDTCRTSALGEAIELASMCRWGDEPTVLATQQELGKHAINPDTLQGYSPKQISERGAWNVSKYADIDWRPAKFDASRKIDWLECRTAELGEVCWIPAEYLFIGEGKPGDEACVAIADTSGCGVGQTVEDAKLHAICELIERDATARWWYGGQPAPLAPIEWLSEAAALLDYVVNRGRVTKLFDLGSEFAVRTVAAASWDLTGRRVAFGFATKMNAKSAAVSACLELLQTEIGIDQRENARDPVTLDWLANVNCQLIPHSSEGPSLVREVKNPSPKAQLSMIFKCLGNSGLSAIFANMSRPEFSVPAVRAICPGLCTGKPRFGASRLSKNHDGTVHNPRPLAV